MASSLTVAGGKSFLLPPSSPPRSEPRSPALTTKTKTAVTHKSEHITRQLMTGLAVEGGLIGRFGSFLFSCKAHSGSEVGERLQPLFPEGLKGRTRVLARAFD